MLCHSPFCMNGEFSEFFFSSIIDLLLTSGGGVVTGSRQSFAIRRSVPEVSRGTSGRQRKT